MFLTFSNAILLIGLAAVVVPLVLHLLSRARYQSVEWGAMLFLEGLEGRQQHSAKLTQALLLAMRMAVVALLSAALAQPVLQQWSPDIAFRGNALRAAHHGEWACTAAAVGCGVGAVLLMLRGWFAPVADAGPRPRRRLVHMLLALALAAGASAFVYRAGTWRAEARVIQAQPQPAAPSPEGAIGTRGRIDAAILLDCSPSMNFDENGRTRFAMAQSAARQVLAGLHRGDRASLILMGRAPDGDDRGAAAEPTADLQSIADRIDAARPGREPADVAEALRQAQEALGREGGRAARDLYVVGDRQALSWRNVNDYFMTTSWPELVRRSGGTRVFAVPVGSADADNVAVEDITLVGPPAIVGQPASVEVDVHNYGPTARAALPMEVRVGGGAPFRTTVSVLPGHVARVSVPIRADAFASAGTRIVSAEVRSAGYRDDDRLEAVVEAIDPIRVLVVSGDEAGEEPADAFRGEADFLRLALAPLQSSKRKGADPCKVDVVPEDRWSQVDLRRYQVVVLANVERFSSWQTRLIEQFVYGGGGLLVAPGSLTRVGNYNEELWRDGAGILPAELQDATSSDGAEATAVVGYDADTPVLHFLRDRPDLMLSATIGRYFPVNVKPSDARTLAWYTSGTPFLVESRAGRGRVLLMTTSLDADWSTLPLSNVYLPLVQSAVRYLAAGTMPVRDLQPGEPIRLNVADTADPLTTTIDLPGGDAAPAALTRFGGEGELRFNDTHEPGVYRMHVRDAKGERIEEFAVRPPRDESDLTSLSDRRWAELEAGLHLKRIDPNERPLAAVVSGVRDGYDLWPWALSGLLLLSTVELALARHWSRDSY